MTSIKVNNEKQLNELINNAADKIENNTQLMKILANTMQYAVDQNFQSGGRPKWAGLKYRQGQPLINAGELRSSIRPDYGKNFALVGTNVPYAAIHQFGGKTKPHTIRPVLKKALAFNGGVFKAVHHPGSKIPARPFLKLTEQDERDLEQDVVDYINEQI